MKEAQTQNSVYQVESISTVLRTDKWFFLCLEELCLL